MSAQPRQPVKIAIIGTGAIGPRHAAAVRRDPDAALVCIVDPSPGAIQVAIGLGTIYYPSVRAMLASVGGGNNDNENNKNNNSKKPNVAIVCTPNDTHAAVATELLSAGVHVLCEKPLSIDVASGQALVEHAAARHLQLLTAHHRRFNPYVAATKRILASEAHTIGQITAVSGLWALYKPQAYFEPPMDWHRRAGEGGGPVMINLVHDIDVLHHVLGSRVVRVAAFEAPKRRGFAVEEGAAILLHFENGVVGTFVLSDAVVSPHAFEAGTGENPTIPATGRDFYRILGTEGTLSIPDLKRSYYEKGVEKAWSSKTTEVTEKLEDWISKEESAKIPFELQVAHLVKVIRGEEAPVCTGEDGLAAVKVAEAVRRAMREGAVVDVY